MGRHARSVAVVGVCVAAGAMSGCGGDGAGGSSPTTPVPGAAELMGVVANEGITAQPSALSVSDELFDLGQSLYFDKILSGNQDVSCATCHWPELASADARTLPRGVDGNGLGNGRVGGEIIPRHSPHILNAVLMEEMFWDGRVRMEGGNLETPAGAALTVAMEGVFDGRWFLMAAQAMFPVTSRDEMRGAAGENALANLGDSDFQGIWSGLVARLVAIPGYQQMFLNAYPDVTNLSEITFAHAANAIAAFEVAAFTRTDSPWERFVQGDDQALTEAQVAGGLEFFGPAGCDRCHSGRDFSDHNFHNIGLAQFGPGKGDGAGNEDFGRERVTGNNNHRYRFRTPTLLNVELTAPYGRLGQFRTLDGIVGHYQNPTQSLLDYDVLLHTSDTDLHGTEAGNQNDILARLDNRLRGNQPFDVAAVATFLTALTTDSARNLTDLVPLSVPSGLPLR